VSPSDPLAVIASVLLVLLMVAVSALLPARRASHVEPMEALRTE